MSRIVLLSVGLAASVYLGAVAYVFGTEPAKESLPMRTNLSPEFSTTLDHFVEALTVLPNGQVFGATGGDSVCIIEPKAARVSFRKLTPGSHISDVAAMPDGSAIVVAGDEGGPNGRGIIQVYDLRKGTVRKSFRIEPVFPYPILLDHEGLHAYYPEAIGTKNRLRRIDLRSGQVEEILGAKSKTRLNVGADFEFQEMTPAGLSPDGKEILVGVWKGAIVWDLARRCERFSCHTDQDTTCKVAAVSSDGERAATAYEQAILLWDFRTGKHVKDLDYSIGSPPRAFTDIRNVSFSPDSKLFVACIDKADLHSSYVAVWRAPSYDAPAIFRSHDGFIRAASFIPGSHKLVTGGSDKTVKIWNLDKLSWPAQARVP
jgi:WD40 repeat protein